MEKKLKIQQEALLNTNARLQYLMDNTPAVIYSSVASGDSKITTISANVESLLGWSPEEVLADPDFWFNNIHIEDRTTIFRKLPQLWKDGQQTHEYRFRAKNGRYVWIHDTLRLITDSEHNPIEIIGSLLDISKRKQAEEALQREKEEQRILIDKLKQAQSQLLQSEKMASIGQLAAGVAHEINNPIGFVNSNLSCLQGYVQNLLALLEEYEAVEVALKNEPALLERLLQLKTQLDVAYLKKDISDLLDESQEGLARVKEIVQNLKTFSHVGEEKWAPADLHDAIDSTLNIVHNEIKYKAEVEKHYGDIPEVECVINQLNQVFLNMLVNAGQAIDEQGVITIRTGSKDNQVWVEISDNGHGIAKENLTRLFEPFFTTKAVGKGTGLGLSLSYGILQNHNGHVEVESEVGKGTTFRVWLPVRQPQREQSSKENPNKGIAVSS